LKTAVVVGCCPFVVVVNVGIDVVVLPGCREVVEEYVVPYTYVAPGLGGGRGSVPAEDMVAAFVDV
jgi:hypothetical protein